MIPTMETSMSLLLPYLSMKTILKIVPSAFRPDVIRESARPVELEAIPAN